jgi:hypothetical protein
VLQFRDCSVCHESHALQVGGAMSIHTNAQGERCEEPSKVPAPPRRDVTPRREVPPRRILGAPVSRPRDEELEEAFRIARDGKKARMAGDKSKGFDRRIYITEGAYKISGGLPTHGRRK